MKTKDVTNKKYKSKAPCMNVVKCNIWLPLKNVDAVSLQYITYICRLPTPDRPPSLWYVKGASSLSPKSSWWSGECYFRWKEGLDAGQSWNCQACSTECIHSQATRQKKNGRAISGPDFQIQTNACQPFRFTQLCRMQLFLIKLSGSIMKIDLPIVLARILFYLTETLP